MGGLSHLCTGGVLQDILLGKRIIPDLHLYKLSLTNTCNNINTLTTVELQVMLKLDKDN